jgi:hypothetical protein
MEFYAPVAGADQTVFDLLPRALVLTDEADSLAPSLTTSGHGLRKLRK